MLMYIGSLQTCHPAYTLTSNLFDAADGSLGDSEPTGELGLGELGGLPEGG
jgi:hypothetical protein